MSLSKRLSLVKSVASSLAISVLLAPLVCLAGCASMGPSRSSAHDAAAMKRAALYEARFNHKTNK